MKTLWILAAAATFAACHSRSEETGAAPERDTTAVKGGYDTTAAPTPAPADTGMKVDTTAVPAQPPADTTNRTLPSDTTAVPQNPTYDTTGVSPTAPPAQAPGATPDTTMAPPSGDTTMQHDTSSTAPR
jgi:hypothetical protein